MVKFLYKYGCINEFSEALFSGNYLYFARPSDFNDPFECNPVISGENVDEKKYRNWIDKKLKQEGGNRSERRVRSAQLCKSNIYKDQKSLDQIRNDMSAVYSQIGMYCLSEVNDEILMWSHYADNHRGYCLEFEATDHTPFFGTAQKVQYSASYPVAMFLEEDDLRRLQTTLLTKYNGWAYEKEWRMMSVSETFEPSFGMKRYPPRLMKKVIFGSRMREEDKALIKTWLSRRGSPVSVMQAKLHDSRYAVEIIDTTWETDDTRSTSAGGTS